VVLKKMSLVSIEAADMGRLFHIDTHALQGIWIGDGRDERFTRILERNKSSVK
jgi:hypothetical protein